MSAEKLHELLKEARGVARDAYLHGFSDALTDAGVTKIVASFIPGASYNVEGWEARVDEALTSPDLAKELREARAELAWADDVFPMLVLKFMRARDEAQAEVRRTYKELSESITREAEAYERGAKAMREAAARYAEVECGFFAMSAAIRALPVPEEEK